MKKKEKWHNRNVEKFVYFSSVYGIPQYLPMDEKHPVNPHETYAASKAAAEILVNIYALNYGLKKNIDPPKKYVSIETRRRSNAIDILRMCADRLSSLGWSHVIGLEEGLMRTIREM